MNALYGILAGVLAAVSGARLVCHLPPAVRRPGLNGRRRVVPLLRIKPLRIADRVVARAIGWRRRNLGVSPQSVAIWCDGLARQVRSGVVLRESVRVEVPIDSLLADLTDDLRHRLDRGQPLVTVMQNAHVDQAISNTTGHHHLTLACSVIGSVAEVGGSAAAPLDRVASALRLRSADGRERAAHSAQARLSAHVLTTVPLATLTVLVVTDPVVRIVLVTTTGMLCLSAGLALNVVGWWWMHRIIRGPG